jgi:hypothetical protein
VSEEGLRVRRAELVALLSLGTDLGLGQPMEHMIRACLIGLRLTERTALDDADRGVVYYSGLLAWVGCHTDAYEQAKWLGDDLSIKRDAHYGYDMGKPGPAVAFMLKHVGGRYCSGCAPARGSWATDGVRSQHWRRTTTWRQTSWRRGSASGSR